MRTLLKTSSSLIPLIVLITVISPSIAQSGGSFEIIKSIIQNGGGYMSNGQFSLQSSIGQPLIGQTLQGVSTGEEFTLTGGYLGQADSVNPDFLFTDSFE